MANPYFNAVYYLQNNPDLMAAGVTAATAWDHYVQYGANEAYAAGGSVRAPNDWFDARAYLNGNPDLIAAGVTPANALDHFQAYGANELRSPNAQIAASPITAASLVAYVNANADIATALSITIPATTLTAAQQNAVVAQFYGYGINESRPSAPTNFEPQPNPGQTFTLTTNIDNIQGTAGDDTIIGSGPTLQAADVINGGAGTDAFNFTAEGGAAVSGTPNMTAVEQVFVQGLTTAGGTTLNLVNASGVKEVWNVRSTDAIGVNVTNVQELAAVGVRGAITGGSSYLVGFKDSLASGTGDSVTIVLDGATITNLGVSGVTAANEFETLNISASGTSTVTNLVDTAAAALNATKVVNISGDGKVTLGANALSATVTTVDASANTGGVTVTSLAGSGAQTLTGGAGNDTFNLRNTLTTADVVKGGEGSNTIGITDGATLVSNLQVSNFQTLDIGGAGVTAAAFDVSKLSGITTLKVGTATVAGNAVTINNLAKGADVLISAALGNALNVNVKDSGAGSPNDVLNVSLSAAANFTTGSNLVVANIETLNLSSATSGTGQTTHTLSNITAAQATTINVNASTNGLTITNLEALALVKFDASESVKAVSVTTGADAFSATGGTAFTLGQGNDTLVLTGATSASTGTDFVISGGKGGDAITLTAAGQVEVLKFAAGESLAGQTGTNNNFDTITTFTTTEDKIDLKSFGFTGTVVASVKEVATTAATAATFINTTTGVVLDAKQANFFGAGGDQRAVAIVEDDTNTWVYVDANGDGSFQVGTDLAIQLAGVTLSGAQVFVDTVFA